MSELKPYVDNSSPLPREAELLIIKTILYFVNPHNWNFEIIENVLLPGIIQYSHTFKGGKYIDLTKFENFKALHLRAFARVFPDVEKLTIRTGPSNDLKGLLYFEKLKTLDVHLGTNCRFNTTRTRLPIRKLHVLAEDHAFCIQELIQCSPKVEYFYLTGGQLTTHSIALLHKLPLRTISLTNVQMDLRMSEAALGLLLKTTIKRLKIVAINQKIYNGNFKALSEALLSYIGPNSSIEDLTFTLNQGTYYDVANLRHSPKLKKITIYFTSQESTLNLFESMRVLLTKIGLELQIIEYYDYDKHTLNEEYVRTVRERSQQVKNVLKAVGSHVVTTGYLDHTSHFPPVSEDLPIPQ